MRRDRARARVSPTNWSNARSVTGIAPVPSDRLGQPRTIGDEKNHEDAALIEICPQPDRVRARTQTVRTARVISLEDLRGEKHRGVKVAPAEQAMLRVQPGIAHEALHCGTGLLIDTRHRLSRVGDPLEPEPAPSFVDLRPRCGNAQRVPKSSARQDGADATT